MIKLIAIEPRDAYKLLLRFSDDTWDVFDFAPIIEKDTEMARPLRDQSFFERHFIELGALACPKGLDFGAESPHRRLQSDGKLTRGQKVA